MDIRTQARRVFLFAVSALMISAWATGAAARPKAFTQGPCAAMFGAQACSFYRLQAGQVRAFGLHVPLAALEQVPENPPMVWPPREAAVIPLAPIVQKQTGFGFVTTYWEAHGHKPDAYMFPHFDFHFYFISREKREALDCKNSAKPQALPAGYSLPDITIPPIGELVGLCVPYMGMHAIPSPDLASGTSWDASMIVGYYAGTPIFIEPMITRARLLEKRKFALTIPRIQPVGGVRYPKSFRAVYLPGSKAYDLIFSY